MELLRTVPKCFVRDHATGSQRMVQAVVIDRHPGRRFWVLPPPSRTGHANASRAAIGFATGDLYCVERMAIGLHEKTLAAKRAPKFARADSDDGGSLGVGISF